MKVKEFFEKMEELKKSLTPEQLELEAALMIPAADDFGKNYEGGGCDFQIEKFHAENIESQEEDGKELLEFTFYW